MHIVVSGKYPYEFWGPFDEETAQAHVKKFRESFQFAAAIRLKKPMSEPLTGCPYCGGKTYTFYDHSIKLEYNGCFGKGRAEEECVFFHHTKPAPMYCKCDECGRKIKLSTARNESP